MANQYRGMSDEQLEAEHTKVGEAGVKAQAETRKTLEAIKAEQTRRVKAAKKADLQRQMDELDGKDVTVDLNEADAGTGEDA